MLQEYIAGAPEGERGPRSKPKRVFDDNKVTDHHAIVPTGKLESMTGEHRLVFDAVATRFVQVFMGNRMQDVTTVHAKSVDVPFRARGVVITDPGWSALEPSGDSDKPKPKGKRVGNGRKEPLGAAGCCETTVADATKAETTRRREEPFTRALSAIRPADP
mgnify:CR=1 FL=1